LEKKHISSIPINTRFASMSDNLILGIPFDGPLLPTTEGASNRVYNLAKYLSLSGLKVNFLKCYRECDKISKFKKESLETKINFFLIHPNIYYKNFKIIENIIKKEKINFLQIKDPELILTLGVYLKKRYNFRICFDSHDATHVLLQRLGCKKSEINLSKFKELAANQYSDLHICVSTVDRKELIKIGCNEEKIKVIPNGVDTKTIKYVGPNLASKTVLFLGHMFYYPNTYAVQIICKKIIPTVLKYDKKVNFLFVGACPIEIIKKYQNKNIKFVGPVENLNEYLKKATIAISPLFHGSGTRIKILHYFAAGLPVISTELGAEGLDVKNNKHLILEDNITKYPKIILEMLENVNNYKRMIKNARKLTEKKYDWNKLAKKLKKIYLKFM